MNTVPATITIKLAIIKILAAKNTAAESMSILFLVERGRRIELLALAWKAKVLPLYEPRVEYLLYNNL